MHSLTHVKDYWVIGLTTNPSLVVCFSNITNLYYLDYMDGLHQDDICRFFQRERAEEKLEDYQLELDNPDLKIIKVKQETIWNVES